MKECCAWSFTNCWHAALSRIAALSRLAGIGQQNFNLFYKADPHSSSKDGHRQAKRARLNEADEEADEADKCMEFIASRRMKPSPCFAGPTAARGFLFN